MLFHDNTYLCLQYCAHYLLPKLTDIARPRMGLQCFSCFRIEPCHGTFQFIVGYLTEKLRQRHDVLLTVTQRWNYYLEVVQTVQQVLPETFFNDSLFQILVGGGDDADIEALVRLVRTRKRAFDMSEECRGRKFFGERTAVHSHKRFSCPLALIMQMVGDMLLARTVLPEYQYTHIGRGYQPYPVHDFLKGGTVTGKNGHTASPDTPFFQDVAKQRHKFILHKLFGNVVQRAEFHAFHRRMHFGIVGHDDERLHHAFLAHPS